MQKSTVYMKNATNKIVFLSTVLIVAVTVMVYLQMFGNEFVNWDDDRYITENPYITTLSWNRVADYFTNYYDGHYHPLTMLSLAADYSMAGKNPLWFHTTNLLLHVANALLVFWFVSLLAGTMKGLQSSGFNMMSFLQDKRKRLLLALAVSLLFALHPLQVESVAWMSERKNLLFAFFFFAACIAYIKYNKSQQGRYYALACFLFVLGILAKVTAITFAISLFLIDFLYRRKLLSRKVLQEKLPFILVAIVMVVVAGQAQSHTWDQHPGKTLDFSLIERTGFAAYSFFIYLIKLLVPYRLSAFYPYPDPVTTTVVIKYLFFLIPALVFIGSVYWGVRKERRLLVFGLLFFLVNIAPLLKLFDVPRGDYIMADRYVYVPSVGIFLIVFMFLFNLSGRVAKRSFRMLCVIFAGIYLVSLTVVTHKRISVWENDTALFSDVLDKYPNVGIAWNNLGLAQKRKGNFRKAYRSFTRAIEIEPSKTNAWNNRGSMNAELGNHQAAEKDFSRVIRMNPKDTVAYFHRGMSRAQLKQWKMAIEDYSKTLEMRPKFAQAYLNRGVAYAKKGKFREALNDFNSALELRPDYTNVYYNRGNLRARLGSFKGAVKDFTRAVESNPRYMKAYLNRAKANAYLQEYNHAIADCRRALKINPNATTAHRLLKAIKARKGQRQMTESDNIADNNIQI